MQCGHTKRRRGGKFRLEGALALANLNRVFLIGNLTREVELRYTPRGTPVAEIGLGINRVWTDEEGRKREEVTFVDISLWDRLAQLALQYLKKGKPVFIEGRLQLDSWTDKPTGQPHSKLRVVATNLQLLGSKSATPHREPAAPPPRSTPTAKVGLEPDLDVR
jgi:single-strand DNA-binding protein